MNQTILTSSGQSVLTTNRVLRNTYALLGLLFVFGAGAAYVAQAQHWHINGWMFLAGIIGFSVLIGATRNSAWGLLVAFAFAGFLGVVTGGNIDYMVTRFANGGMLVTASFLMTAVAFFGLSGYAMVAKRDFSGWIGFLVVGTLVALGAFVTLLLLRQFTGINIEPMALALSSMVILLASGWILWQTQRIVRGGETNYILAATGLLADIFAIFNNLMHLLGFGFGDD